ncbi:acyl--CoA ligase, partial [Nocardiopsis sp. HNM0947]
MPPQATACRTIPDLLTHNAEKHPDLPALSWRQDDGTWTTLTWAATRDRVLELAAGFHGLGIGPGDHVLILMGNRHEHWLTDVALAHLGAPTTTVYSTAAPEQIGYIARHSRAHTAVVDTAGAAWRDLAADPDTPLERLVVVDDPEPGRGDVPFSSVLDPAGVPALLDRPGAVPEDLLTVVYTSGTTGDPKGAAMTHGDVLANITSLDRLVQPLDHP